MPPKIQLSARSSRDPCAARCARTRAAISALRAGLKKHARSAKVEDASNCYRPHYFAVFVHRSQNQQWVGILIDPATTTTCIASLHSSSKQPYLLLAIGNRIVSMDTDGNYLNLTITDGNNRIQAIDSHYRSIAIEM